MVKNHIDNDPNEINSVLLQKYPISKSLISNDKYDRNGLNSVLLQKYLISKDSIDNDKYDRNGLH